MSQTNSPAQGAAAIETLLQGKDDMMAATSIEMEGVEPSALNRCGDADSNPGGESILKLQQTVLRHFPDLWSAVDLGLAACMTLTLRDVVNCTAIVYVGPPAGGKTTVLSMFDGATYDGKPLTYLSDKFTPASFVSQAANVTEERLKRIDLLPRIRHKALITPELSPTFRGKDDELTQRFSLITRVLDGQGLRVDGGTHGGRGYQGDYVFTWLGGTTPLQENVWRVMANLGSRLFFLFLDSAASVTVDDLIQDAVPYHVRVTDCRQVVHGHLAEVFKVCGGVRGFDWDRSKDEREIKQWIGRFALLISRMRGVTGSDGEAQIESPQRAYAILYNLGRGHALIHGRPYLTAGDLPILAQVTASSMPTKRSQVFRAFAESDGGELYTADVKHAIRRKDEYPAKQVMTDLHQLEIMDLVEPGNGKASYLRLRPEWTWCGSPEFWAMLRPTRKFGGVCKPLHSQASETLE